MLKGDFENCHFERYDSWDAIQVSVSCDFFQYFLSSFSTKRGKCDVVKCIFFQSGRAGPFFNQGAHELLFTCLLFCSLISCSEIRRTCSKLG